MKYLLVIPAILFGIALLGASAAPRGSTWLGSGIMIPSDTAVYLSYLRQGAEGHALLSNLYAVELNRPRFDLVWSTLGFLARTGIPLVVVYESARILFCCVLICAIRAAAKRLFPIRRDANFATMLAFGGIGTGWLYSMVLRATNEWDATVMAAPDVASEFAIGPTLLGGVHMILAIALLVTAIRLLWNGFQAGSRRDLVIGSLAGAALIAFHPYATPILGLFSVVSMLHASRKRQRIFDFILVSTLLSPPVLYYAWLLTDPAFATHHLSINVLPLANPLAWIMTLLPFGVAGFWMWRKRIRLTLDWPLVWLCCSIVLLLFLPVPWKRKLAEGLLIPIVFLTMPAWMAVRDWTRRIRPSAMRIMLTGALILAAFLSPLHLVLSQLAWWGNISASKYFFASNDLLVVTNILQKTTSRDDILLADEFWIDVWLPSLTGRRVWLGHDHETPLFASKNAAFHTLLKTTSSTQALAILHDAGVTRLITTTEERRVRFAALIGAAWSIGIRAGDVSVWQRIDQR